MSSVALDDLIAENERALAQEQGRIVYLEGMELAEGEEPSLEQMVTFAKEQEKVLAKCLEEQQREFARIDGAINRAEEENKLFDNLDHLKQKEQKLKEQELEEKQRH